MVLSDYSIRILCQEKSLIVPFVERQKHEQSGTSFGLSMCGYDMRLDQDVSLRFGMTCIASTMERFIMPNNLMAVVHDKSTWARRGVSVQNTCIEPGWQGFLTLEISYAPIDVNPSAPAVLNLIKGTPIAQIIFHQIDRSVDSPYNGKYQNQERGPQHAR